VYFENGKAVDAVVVLDHVVVLVVVVADMVDIGHGVGTAVHFCVC
jgi:hypothetical protein